MNENLIRYPSELAPGATVQQVRKHWERVLWKKVHEMEEEEWRRDCKRKPKLRTYVTFKEKLELENYLLSEKEKQGRYLLTRLRTGTNRLRIETGRIQRPILKPQERVCLQCNGGEIEDEKHFLLRCPHFRELRKEMFNSIQEKVGMDLESRSEEQQWKALMGQESTPGQLSDIVKKFVRKAMKERTAP